MAMIHESCGTVISDPTGTYKVGQKVVMIPNQPPMQSDEEFYENYMTGTYFLIKWLRWIHARICFSA